MKGQGGTQVVWNQKNDLESNFGFVENMILSLKTEYLNVAPVMGFHRNTDE